MNACCSGCRLPFASARPSTVVMFLPASLLTLTPMAEVALPLTSTRSAPPSPCSPPYLVPLRRSTSRRYHSSGISGSPVWRNASPLICRSTPGRTGVGVISAALLGSAAWSCTIGWSLLEAIRPFWHCRKNLGANRPEQMFPDEIHRDAGRHDRHADARIHQTCTQALHHHHPDDDDENQRQQR